MKNLFRSRPFAHRGVPVDLAPAGRLSLPETGLGRGWEAPAVLITAVLLVLFGLLTLYSASSVMAQRNDLPHYYYVYRQSVGVALGFIALAVCSQIPSDWWQRLAWPLMALSVGLLVLIILPFTHSIAPEIKGARRWLQVGITIQPSDVAKIGIIVWTAALAVRKQGSFRSLRTGLGPFLLMWGVLLLPIALEPDFSTAALVALLGFLVVFVAGGRIGHFVLMGLVVGPPALWWLLSSEYRLRRVFSFMNPGSDPTGDGFQVYQSLLAMGSGGITGVGFGEGRQKFGFLPEAHNDFIMAMIGEEWGFLGTLVVVLLYVFLIAVGFRIARRARNLFSELLAVGVTSLIGLQAFLHMGVGLGLLPPTGLALPLISYGRSNMLVSMAAIGILLAVAREAPEGRFERGGA